MNFRDFMQKGGARGEFQPITMDDWAQMFTMGFQGIQYPTAGTQGTLGSKVSEPPGNFRGFVEHIYKNNGPVFSCMVVRMMLFSEARFQFRRLSSGRPGNLFGNGELKPLESPWPNGTTGDLLNRMIQDVDLSGNSYTARMSGQSGRLRRLRPDWMTIVMGSQAHPDDQVDGELDAELIGYAYQPGGPGGGRDLEVLLPEQVAHFAPIPDPCATFRGMSWLSPIVREILGDQSAMEHKKMFFEQGATPNIVVTLGADVKAEKFDKWVDAFESEHAGVLNAYKTLYLGGGANVDVVGANMRQVDFKQVQGHGETRIAAAAGVPPVIAGFSEGLEAATYSNYSQARRRFADGTMRPLWRNAAGSLAAIINVPSGAELWYDDRDIQFLADDQKDKAEVQKMQAEAIRALVDAGFESDSVIDAINSGDLAKLSHSGLYSVQLQPAGSHTGGLTTAVPSLKPGAGNNGGGKQSPQPAQGG